MQRNWQDDLGRTWRVDLVVPERAENAERGDTFLVFGRDGSIERNVPILGPLESIFEDLDDDELQVAFDAAGTAEGRILVDRDDRLWWVHGPSLETEPVRGSWAVRFVHGSEEVTHGGPLWASLEDLTEDELLELLDQGRGNVLEEMDVTGG